MIFHRLYRSIDDLPIYNWVEFTKSGNMEVLVIKKRWRYPRKTPAIIEGLFEQFYSRFGKTKDFLGHMQKLRKLTLMICQNAIEFDPATDIHIKALEAEVNKFTGKEDFDFAKNLAALSKWAGYRIDPKSTSVAEYYGMIRYMEESAVRQKAAKEASK